MNDRCERMRERIEDSIGKPIGAGEQAKLDRHCAECESCGEYRQRLLEDHLRLEKFAALHAALEQRAEERVIAALPEEAPIRARRSPIRDAFVRLPGAVRIAIAAAAVVVVVAGIDLLRGARNGAVPAFAAIIEKMEKAESVIYRNRRWKLGEWTTEECGEDRSRTFRAERADSTVLINYHGRIKTRLCLYPSAKRANLKRYRWKTPQERNPSPENSFVEGLASWHKRMKFSFVRRERFEGRSVAVFERITGKSVKIAIWVDLETELPLRVEMSHGDSAISSTSYPYGLYISDFMPPGAPRSAAAGWTELVPGEPVWIWDSFRWNTQPDTSYFSLMPPPGYAVSKIDTVLEPDDWEKEAAENYAVETSPYARGIVKALTVWVSLSGGSYPDDFQDLGDSSKVRPLLIAEYDKDGRPGDEFRAAFEDASQLARVLDATWYCSKEGNFHYMGKGATFGDSTRIVCWGKETNEFLLRFVQPYWTIYADLRCVPSPAPPKISGR